MPRMFAKALMLCLVAVMGNLETKAATTGNVVLLSAAVKKLPLQYEVVGGVKTVTGYPYYAEVQVQFGDINDFAWSFYSMDWGSLLSIHDQAYVITQNIVTFRFVVVYDSVPTPGKYQPQFLLFGLGGTVTENFGTIKVPAAKKAKKKSSSDTAPQAPASPPRAPAGDQF